jgi:hypothetical protein
MNSIPRNRIQLGFWGGAILVSLLLLYRDHATGTPPASSLGALLFSAGQLCWYLQPFVSRDAVRRRFYVMNQVLFVSAVATLVWLLIRPTP